MNQPTCFPVLKACQLDTQPAQESWLINNLWGREAVGVIGGAPKCGKSWLGLDMAISVASGSSCLDHFGVEITGPTLIYLAEDSLPAVRNRVHAICLHRGLMIQALPLYVITAPMLRIDLESHQTRLHATLATIKPQLLLLDPLVRLHRGDENSSADISRILGFLREVQRIHHTAVVLVHHASKKQRSQPGQALRGSSDLHAFGDSNLYLARRKKQLTLTFEHRCAKPPDPLTLQLVSRSDGSATHLEVRKNTVDTKQSLDQRILSILQHQPAPLTRTALRTRLKVNNQRLGDALLDLERRRLAGRNGQGWISLSELTGTQKTLF